MGVLQQDDNPRQEPSPKKQRQQAEQSRQEPFQQAIARARPSDSSRDRLNAFQQLKALARERIADSSDSSDSSADETKDDDESEDGDSDDDKRSVDDNGKSSTRDRMVANLDNADAVSSRENEVHVEIEETKHSDWIHLTDPTQEPHDTTHSHLSSLIKFAKIESNYSSTEDVGLKEVMKRAQIARERFHAGVNQSMDVQNEKSDGAFL
jgi:hypothetical protein